MADLAAQISEARKNGYSDDDIVGYLGTSHPELAPKIKEAQTHGYGAGEIVGHLAGAPSTPAVPRTWLDSVSDFGKGFWNNLAESGQSMVNAVAHPIDTVKGIGTAQDQVRLKAEDAFKRGDYAEGVRHVLGYLVPMVGPSIDASGDKAQQGKVAEALGEATSTGLQLAAPELLKNVKLPVGPRVTPKNPVTAETMKWAQDNNLPIPAGPATGNTYVQVLQRGTENTPLGSLVTDPARQKLADAMGSKGRSLAAQVEPTAVVPETAGAAVAGELKSTISALRKDADVAYGKFRTAADDPKNAIEVQTGKPQQFDTGVLDAQGNPITQTIQATEKMPMPVDMREIKAKLEPLYVEMKQWMPISSRNASEGFAAVKGIVEGPDYMPAPVAEKGLSGLKAMAREADSPDLRNVSQGIGAHAAGQLQKSIDAAALRAGPDVYDALRKGRTAFESKMAAADVLDKMRDEPVQLFNQATYAQDAGINQLREAAKLAPEQMPKIGRAYLEKLMDQATSEGGFDKGRGLYSQWQNLGPETKKVLFRSPELVDSLDKFFRLGKLLADQPNPSMTAVVSHGLAQGTLMIANPAVGIPYAIGSAALAKLMYSPEFVRAVTAGMKVPLKGPGAALAAAQILKLAGKDAQPVQE